MYSKCYRVIYKLSSVTVKFSRILEEILDKRVKYGIAETKSEAIRVARGGMLVGVADSRGTLYNPQRLDVNTVIELKKADKSVAESPTRVA